MALSEPTDVFDAGAFAQFALELHDAAGVDETLETVLQFALQAANCTYAGVALAAAGTAPRSGRSPLRSWTRCIGSRSRPTRVRC